MRTFLALLFLTGAVRAQNITNFVAGRSITAGALVSPTPSSGGGYSYYSTSFAGASGNHLLRDSAFTGAASGSAATISVWVKFTSSTEPEPAVFKMGSGANARFILSAYWPLNLLYVKAYDSAGVLLLEDWATGIQLNVWYHIFCSINVATSSHVFLTNGVSAESLQSTTSGTIDLAGANWQSVAAWHDGTKPGTLLLSELWFSAGYTASPAAWRSSGHPANLGADGSTPTGIAPLVYLRNPYSSITNNLGTGGSFYYNNPPANGGADLP